jgi:hypothetical protein
MLWRLRFVGGGVRRFDCLNGEHGRREQFAGAGDVLGALAAAVRIAMVIRTSITAKRRSVSETVRRVGCGCTPTKKTDHLVGANLSPRSDQHHQGNSRAQHEYSADKAALRPFGVAQ